MDIRDVSSLNHMHFSYVSADYMGKMFITFSLIHTKKCLINKVGSFPGLRTAIVACSTKSVEGLECFIMIVTEVILT